MLVGTHIQQEPSVEPEQANVLWIIRFLRRRAALITLVAIAGCLGTGIYVVRLQPEYTATATVVFDPRQARVVDIQTTQASSADTTALNTEAQLVKSQTVGLAVAKKLVASDLLESTINAAAVDGLAEGLRNQVQVARIGESYIIAISFSAQDPRAAAFIANAFAEEYLSTQIAAKFEAIQRADRWLESRISDLKARVQGAENAVAAQRMRFQQTTDLRAKSGEEIRLQELQREADATKSLLETFLAKSMEIGEEQTLHAPESRIVSKAPTPIQPTGPRRLVLLGAGLLLSVGLGVGVALFLEIVDGSIRTAASLEAAFGAPVLSSIPFDRKLSKVPFLGNLRRRRLHGGNIAAAIQQVRNEPYSPFSESIRTLWVSARHTHPVRASSVLLITSALPGEGKSIVAGSLATLAAEEGGRVLLVDMDLRRPALSSALSSRPQREPVQHEEPPIGETIRKTEFNFSFLPASALPSGYTLDQQAELLARLGRQSFDQIIIDAPPLIPVSDAQSILPQVDGAIFIVEWGKTQKDAVRTAFTRAPQLAQSLLGFVLTKVDSKRASTYDYYNSGHPYQRYEKRRRKWRHGSGEKQRKKTSRDPRAA